MPWRISKCSCGWRDIAGVAGIADHLALGDMVAAVDQQPLGMGVGGDIAVARA